MTPWIERMLDGVLAIVLTAVCIVILMGLIWVGVLIYTDIVRMLLMSKIVL